jgi:hypothetical protein
MKKIILSLCLVAVVGIAQAQVTVYRATNVPMTVNAFPGTTVPTYIVTNFEQAYPGVTVIGWEPVRTYWRASYNKDNRIIYVFYDERGINYRASLPVLQNNVSEDVVAAALRVHGPIVYNITRMKGANDTEVYQVRLLDNGTTKLVWMNADGTTAENVFKVHTTEVTPVTTQGQ